MKAFLCANCFRYQLTPPKPACALKSALEVSLWTLPKWPKTGGPPAEPRVWKWVDTLPRKDVTIQIRKFFTSNFIRQIYQSLIYHDLSSIHIYSWNWPRKKCATLILVQSHMFHRSSAPKKADLNLGALGDSPTANYQPGKRLEIRPPALEERPPFWPKETPIKETAKVLHQRPQASKDHILSDIWFDFTKKKQHCLGRWPLMYFWFMLIYLLVAHTDCWCISNWECFSIFKSNPWEERLPRFNPLVRVVQARTMEAKKHWAWDVQSGQPVSKPKLRNLFRGNPC